MTNEPSIEKNIILLLTGTINTYNKEFALLSDPVKRKADYINTIRYYLEKFEFPIVFVENSNEDISSEFLIEIKDKRLEVISFQGNKYPKEMGKGLGEMACIEYGMIHSKIIDQKSFLFKITGRYKILNLQKFIDFYCKHPNAEIMADLTNNFKSSQSGIFGFKPIFAQNFLLKYGIILNDSKGVYFEHALAKAVLNAISENLNFYIFKNYPKIEAISGTTEKEYRNSFIYFIPREIKYLLRYFIVIR